MGTFKRSDGSIADPGSDTLQHLIDTHSPTATPIKPTIYDIYKSVTKVRVAAWLPPWFTSDKLLIALKQFQNKKSPGPDGLRPISLKNLPQKCLKLLLLLYKASILIVLLPLLGKVVGWYLYPNPGKITISLPNLGVLAISWRPISLTNYIPKALKCLCGWHMDDAIKHSPVHTQHHGFCTDRNTDTAISTVTDYIERHIYNQKHVIGVFLDIQAAFDSIKPSKIKEALLQHIFEWHYS